MARPLRKHDARRPSRLSAVLAVTLVGAACAVAVAGVVMEEERKLEASNDTIATAQVIPSDAFAPNANPDIPGDLPTVSIVGRGGGSDVDFYAFDMFEPGVIMTGLTDKSLSFDPFVSVFAADGSLLAFSTPPDPEADADTNSKPLPFVGVLYIPEPGVYYIAISSAANMPRALRTDLPQGDEPPPALDTTRLIRPDGRPGGLGVIDPPPALDDFADTGAPEAFPYTMFLSVSAVTPPLTTALLDLLSTSAGDVPVILPSGPFRGPIAGDAGGSSGGGGGGGGGDDGGGGNGGNGGGGETPVIPLPGAALMGLLGLGALAMRRQPRPL